MTLAGKGLTVLSYDSLFKHQAQQNISKLFETLIVFKKVDFEKKISRRQKSKQNYLVGKGLNFMQNLD